MHAPPGHNMAQTSCEPKHHTLLPVIDFGADPAATGACEPAPQAPAAPGNGGNAPLLGAELLNTGTCKSQVPSEHVN